LRQVEEIAAISAIRRALRLTYILATLMPTILAVVLAAQTARAQTTIFNIPTTDVVDKGQQYFEFDLSAQLPKPDLRNRLYIYNPRFVAGVAPNVEAGVNIPSLRMSPTTDVFFEPNIKWRFFNNDRKGLAAAGGGILFTPLNHRDNLPTYGLLYVEASKKVKSTYGPRVHLGPYRIVHAGEQLSGPKSGVLAGYEQPLLSDFSIVADWFSGKNTFGYFTPGVELTLPGNGVFDAGYSLGNDSYHGNDNRFLVFFYGITF
jgi:hypothetical protein